ncbi:YbaN family protein [Bacteroidales bacterium OttesenSCG-928-B11]|nr:YbaN family protein [Bacteroidales bacterium OttesenSCG-928-B11]
MKKALFLTIGFISLGLGILGIFLPVLPTTPFLLLTAALFAKSSDRWYRKLISHPKLGPYILDFREHRSIPLRAKIITIGLLWITIGFSVIFAVTVWWLRGILLGVAVGVSIHVGSFATKK